MEPDVFWSAAMHQEDKGYQHPRDEESVYQIALPPAIPSNEPGAPRCKEKRPHASTGQGETGGQPAATVKPLGHQRDMRDEAQGREPSTDDDTIIEVELP
jgi:hypothetical protein